VITRPQLRALGYSDHAIDRWLELGWLHPIHRGVFAVGRSDLPAEGYWLAAVLACGPDAALSHESAAAFWGLGPDPRPIVVSVPADRHPRPTGVNVRRRVVLPTIVQARRIPVTDPLATLVDLAVSSTEDDLERLVNDADKAGLISIDKALEILDSNPPIRGVSKLRRTLSDHTVTDSDLERRFLKLVRKAGLAAPQTQVVLHGVRVDFYWPELGLVVETDGLTYHRTPSQQAKDRKRDQVLTAAGLTCLRFTNRQVRREPSAVIETLRTVVARLQPPA
jgi:very-short-patch-repair endonuclease